jgi:hypothetical protein
LAERPYQGELAELNFESVMFARLRLYESRFSDIVQRCVIKLATIELLFRLSRTPWQG